MAAGKDPLALATAESTNFFRICYIILDDVPRILTDIFKKEVQTKHGHKWSDSTASGKWLRQQEKWHLKLLPEQIRRMESGNTNEWDLPLLFDVLLHSSLCLLADQVPDLQVSLIPGLNAITVMPTAAQSRDLTSILKQDDKVIFNLPNNEMLQAEVINVQKCQFSITRRFNLPPSLQGISAQQPLIVDATYVCTREWCAVEKLSCLHSDNFSHRKEASASNTDLRMVIQRIEGAYDDLNVPTQHLKNIETEHMDTEYYRKKWTLEHQRMLRLKQGIRTNADSHTEQTPKMKDSSEEIRNVSQDQTPQQTKVMTSPMTGRSTEEYLKMMERRDKLINQLASAKCSGILADKLHSAHAITDPVYEEALNAGPGVVETSRIRPVVSAVLAKVEMNTDHYYKFLDILQELGGLQDTVQMLQAPLQQLESLNPDPVPVLSQTDESLKHSGLVVPEHEGYPSDHSLQNEVITTSTGRNTDEYLKILKRCDRIVNQLASAKCSGVLADKLHSTHFITDAIYEEALNVGPGVVETSRVRPVIGAVLAKVEMNTDNYYIFLAALVELGGLDDILQLIEAPLQQSDYLSPDPLLPLSQSTGIAALSEAAKELQTHQMELEEEVQQHSEQIDELQHTLTDARSHLEEDIMTVQLRQVDISQLMSKHTSDIVAHGDRIKAHESQIKDAEVKVDVLQQTQTDTASKVSHGLESMKQMSTELDETGKKLTEMQTEVDIIAKSERQLSEEAKKTTEVVHQLSAAEEETAGYVMALEGQMHEIQDDVFTLKEDVELILQDSKSTDDPLKKLNPSHFESDISYYSEKHHHGTREWLFDQINKWHKQTPTNKNQHKIHLITGNPGMGKSVIAARLCTMAKERGALAGYFFFQHHMSRRSNPKMMVQTLAYQFCSTIPEYQAKVQDLITEANLGSMTAPELFTYLILEPLHQLPSVLPNMYVIIDALDECDFDSRTDLLKLIIREFVKLPKWISVVLTSRPDQKILQRLRKVKPVIELHPKDPINIRDITVFLSDLLRSKLSPEEFEAGIELLVGKSEGMFLYFHYAADTLMEEEVLSLEKIRTLLPDGIDDYYDQNFQRLYRKLGKEKYQTLLQAVIAARADLPQALVAPLLQISSTDAGKVIEMVSILLPVHNDHIHMFHKSVRDWLTDKELAGEYVVDPSTGHQHLATLCHSVLQRIKADATTLAEFLQGPNKRYIIENVIYHICNANTKLHSLSEKLISILMDLQFMHYRLLLSKGKPEDLLEDFTLAKTLVQSNAQLRQKIQDCEAFTKKHAQLLGRMPHLVFQCALNEPDAFSHQLSIDSYKADPNRFFPDLRVYLEVTNKPQSFTSALITYACSNTITSFVQSSDESVMICSDEYGKVYIWNKQTAELLHDTTMEGFQFTSPIYECSISPDGKLVAYGSIKEAMGLDGNLVPLIPDANSDTTACVFSPNGKKLIAWSYYVDGLFKLMAEIGVNFQPRFCVELWDLETGTGRKLEMITKKEKRPMSACFSHDSSHIICGHRDGKIVLWETASAEVVAICNSDGTATKRGSQREPLLLRNPSESLRDDPIYHVTCSPNGHFLAACCHRGILIWDAVSLSLLQTLTVATEMAGKWKPPRFSYCNFSDDSKHIVAGTTDGWLKAWELQPSKPGSSELFLLKVFTKADGSSNSVACCRFDQQMNVICAIKNVLQVYSYEVLLHSTETNKQEPQASHPGNATTCSFLPDGYRAITCGSESLFLWHVPTNSLLASALGSVAGYLHRLSQDGNLLLAFGDRNYIQVWNTSNLTQKHMLMYQRQKNIPPGPGPDDPDSSSTGDICHCAVSNQGLVVGGTGDGYLYLWHGEGYKSVKVLQAHQSLITFCEFSPDGQRFISADMDGKIVLWQLTDGGGVLGVNMVSLEEHEDSIEQVYFSPGQARRIVSCSCDKTLHLYNGPSGDLLKKLKGHNDEVFRVAFSFDGSLIASGDGTGQVLLWDGYTGELKRRLPISGSQILDLCFICGDQFVCTRDHHGDTIQICDVATGSHVSCLAFSAPVCTMVASPGVNDPLLLCCLKDESVKFVRFHVIKKPELCG